MGTWAMISFFMILAHPALGVIGSILLGLIMFSWNFFMGDI